MQIIGMQMSYYHYILHQSSVLTKSLKCGISYMQFEANIMFFELKFSNSTVAQNRLGNYGNDYIVFV